MNLLRHNTINIRALAVLGAWIVIGMIALLAIGACGQDAEPEPTQSAQTQTSPPPAQPSPAPSAPSADEGPPVQVVTTSNIVADWVQNVGDEHVEVFSLLPIGADPHTFQPGARDVARIADADVVLTIGLGMEGGWFVDLVENAAASPDSIIETGEAIDPIEFVEFAEGQLDEIELLYEIEHVIFEVEDGEIDAKEGLEEIEEVLGSMGEHHHDHEGEEEDEDHHDHEGEEEDEDHHDHEGEEEDEDHHDHEGEEEDEDHHDHEGEEEDEHHHDHEGEEEDEDHHEGEEEDEDHHDHEGEEEDEHHHDHEGEEDVVTIVMEILEDVEAGRMQAEDAIESIASFVAERKGEGDDHASADHDHDHGLEDPHYWFDPVRVKIVVDDIASRLSAIDSANADAYRANAAAYNAKLDELHSWTQQQVSVLPVEDRLLVTSHDSFGYFANLYDFEIVGTVLPSVTTEVEPSAGHLAELIEDVKESGVPAVFGETTVSERLASAVARESGAEFVRLFTGSLGPEGSGGATYLEMIRTNVSRIVEALKQ